MTAEEWESCTEYTRMSAPLYAVNHRSRKWYCFALACVRLIEEHLDATEQEAIEVTERYVERQATNRDRAGARALCSRGDSQGEAVYWASAAPSDIARAGVPSHVFHFILASYGRAAANAAERAFADFLREIFPNPFRPVHIDRAWLRWSDGTVRRIAETINDEGDFERMGVLAHALEEAGCTDENILGHLRGPGPHVRGCWVVDLIMGRT
jgi:hypothetical protein